MSTNISPHRGGWKKFVGGRRFYSHASQDQESFRLVASALEVRWKAIKARGESEWSEADVDGASEAAGVLMWPHPVATVRPSIAPTRTGAHLHLFAAIDSYLAQLKTDVPRQISIDTYEKAEQHVPRLKKLLTDGPLDRIEFDDLVNVKNGVINGRKQNDQPYAIETITTILACIKSFFNYLADSDRWLAPRGFDRALKVNRSKLAASSGHDEDDADLQDDETKTFTVEELANIYRVASSTAREMLLFGLCLGFTANDISTLRKSMVVREGDETYIVRKRQKTRHRQKYKTTWWVPPELAASVCRHMLKTSADPAINPHGLLILAPMHLPLVHRGKDGKGHKVDMVSLIWRATIRCAASNWGVQRLSHKHLRKTGGRLVRYGLGEFAGAGLYTAQQFLGHAAQTVAEKQYLGKPDFTDLHAAQKAVYAQLRHLVIEPKKAASPATGATNAA